MIQLAIWDPNQARCDGPAPTIVKHSTEAIAYEPFCPSLTALGARSVDTVWAQETLKLAYRRFDSLERGRDLHRDLLVRPDVHMQPFSRSWGDLRLLPGDAGIQYSRGSSRRHRRWRLASSHSSLIRPR